MNNSNLKLNSNSSSNQIDSYLNTRTTTNSHPTKFFIDSLLSKNIENNSTNTTPANAAAVAAAAFLHQQMISKMFSNNDQLAQLFNQNLFSAFSQNSTESQVKNLINFDFDQFNRMNLYINRLKEYKRSGCSKR